MKCKWTRRATNEYKSIVTYIFNEFGQTAALNFVDDVEHWDSRLAAYPEMGAPEALLADRTRYLYRSSIVGRHNKFIYTVSDKGLVTIVDIWDMRRHPENLKKRIKTK